MGKYTKGILGGFSGKVGTVIGSIWNGIEYMRSLPRRSNKAPSDLQLENRARFGHANVFLGSAATLLNLGMKDPSIGQTGFNQAVSFCMANAVTGSYPDFGIDYPKVLLSKGSLTGVWNAVAGSPQPEMVELSWADNTGSGIANATDKVVIVVYNPLKSQFIFNLQAGAPRSAGADTLAVPANYSGDTVEVWVTFMTPDKRCFATSIHVGQVVVS